MASKSIDFQLSVHPDVPEFVVLDTIQYTQLISNLISNAYKFTPIGRSVKIILDCEGLPDTWSSGKCVTLNTRVVDTGNGMEEKTLKTLFEPYMRGSSEQRKEMGSGLGLAIAFHIAQLFGGDVSVTSTKNVGSSFVARFPVTVASDGNGALSNTTAPSVDVSLPPETPFFGSIRRSGSTNTGSDTSKNYVLNNGGRVLIADNSDINRVLLARMLKKVLPMDVAMDYASDGQEAVDKCMSQEYCVIFMDICMPVLDGYSAAKLIRTSNKSVIIIATTANAVGGDVSKQSRVEAGMNAALSKPFVVAQLREMLLKFNLLMNRKASSPDSAA